MSTEVNKQYKGIARDILQGCANTYHKPCSCSIDFLIEFVFNPHKLPYVSNTCTHCKKLRTLIARVLQYAEDEDMFESEEEDNGEFILQPEFQMNLQANLTLKTPLQRMINYAKELPHYFLFLDQSLEEEER